MMDEVSHGARHGVIESKAPSGYIKTMKRRDPILAKGWGQIVTPLSVQTAADKRY